ncbi:DAHL domain-containing protein [Sphingomonas morindae]|uniref:histidine kinase n=1 Tax=Sphingomonas morindae TaxID=1541170 RepID=A0ABY4XDB2_9SPHN|nr:DAHL domain-containing protein [Sphingomonas morindae]USI74908.1 hypothetical protein LHA26_17195 [Sphingomonas morindae]
MRPRRALFAVGLLIACAALWIILWPGARQRDWLAGGARALGAFTMADRALQRDVLMARAGLIRNYDPLTQESADMRAALAELDRATAPDPAATAAARRLGAGAARRLALVERFKSDNALLQNSLARLAHVSASPHVSEAASLLAAKILRLTLDTTPNAVDAARAALADYERAAHQGDSGEARQLYAHSRLLVRLLPEVDRIVAAILDAPVDREIAATRAALASATTRMDERARHRRLVLAIASGLTAAILVLLAISLHLHVQSLRRRGDFEHLHATILGLMMDVRAPDLPDRIRRALARVAAHVGADRAYLLLDDGRAPAFLWSRRGGLTAPYARAMVEAASNIAAWRDDHIALAPRQALAAEPKAAVSQHGAVPASLVLLRAPESEGAVVLGIERVRGALRLRPETLAGLSTALVAILQAIHRDRLEAERLAFERKAARGRRMETIGAFASGIAHNVNNIIGAIAGFAETAELHVGARSPAAASLAEIRTAVGRARMLVDQVLRFGRRAEHPHERVALGPFIEETARLLGASLPAGVRLRLGPVLPPITLLADAAQVQQVLLNLCHNAAVAMPEGGTIGCEIEHVRTRDPRQLSHAVIRAGDYVVIAVTDQGHGIAPAILPRLFDPFYTTRQGGTGLGLSTAWDIVQQHGGSIDVRSTVGRGSRFSVWLPIADAEQPGPEATPQRGEGQAILLVNPDAEALQRDEELVAALGYEPWGATSLAAAAPLIEACDAILIAGVDGGFCAEATAALRPRARGKTWLTASPSLADDAEGLRYPLRAYELLLALAAVRKAPASG